jgi:hypothetical protein
MKDTIIIFMTPNHRLLIRQVPQEEGQGFVREDQESAGTTLRIIMKHYVVDAHTEQQAPVGGQARQRAATVPLHQRNSGEFSSLE